MSAPTKSLLTQMISRFAPRLRFPQLFALTATLFVLDLVIPDLIPFVDEILLGLATLLLGTMKVPPQSPVSSPPKPPIKDITPPTEEGS